MVQDRSEWRGLVRGEYMERSPGSSRNQVGLVNGAEMETYRIRDKTRMLSVGENDGRKM